MTTTDDIKEDAKDSIETIVDGLFDDYLRMPEGKYTSEEELRTDLREQAELFVDLLYDNDGYTANVNTESIAGGAVNAALHALGIFVSAKYTSDQTEVTRSTVLTWTDSIREQLLQVYESSDSGPVPSNEYTVREMGSMAFLMTSGDDDRITSAAVGKMKSTPPSQWGL